MSRELFEAPFNLACESQSSELTAEGEARVRALAESEARKAQLTFCDRCETEPISPASGQHCASCHSELWPNWDLIECQHLQE